MNQLIYSMCALTALACAWLLLRSYVATRHRLLLWSGLCFVGMTVNNTLLVLDRVVLGGAELATWRLVIALVAVLLLVGGLVLEGDT